MPGNALAGGIDRLKVSDQIQLLATNFTIDTDSGGVLQRIRKAAPMPHQSVAVLHRRTFRVWQADGEFRIAVDSGDDDFELTAFYAVENLLGRMYRDALAALPDHIRLRAAIGSIDGRTFLIAGPRGAGKTTLALSLMFENFDVSGDELVLLNDSLAMAFPSRFRVHEPSVALLPQLRQLPAVAARKGALARNWWFATDPLEFGRSWSIAPAPVSAVFYLEPNHGARSQVVEIGKLDMARHLLAQTTAPPSGRRGWIGEIAHMLDGARTYLVQFGEVASASLAIKRLF